MSLQVGQRAPEFSLNALVGRSFKRIELSQYHQQWVVLFFYPMDFTLLCPTELIELNNKFEEFEDRDAALIGGSTDTEYSHLGWVNSHEGLSDLQYPLFADVTKRTALDYGVLVPETGVALRATFIIDPDGIVRWSCVNSLSVGRNIDEIIRVLDALQTDELCPCNWKRGDETIKLRP